MPMTIQKLARYKKTLFFKKKGMDVKNIYAFFCILIKCHFKINLDFINLSCNDL